MIVYTLLFFLILMLVLNFAIIRPHRKSFNKRAIMLNSVRSGVIVYTVDGIRAKVEAVEKDVVRLSCYPDGVRLLADLESVDRIENYDEKYARSLMDEKIRKGREHLENRRTDRQKKEADTEKSQNRDVQDK